MPFIPHTDADVKAMLKSIGVKSIDDLFDEIPERLRAGKLTQVPEGLSEMEVTRLMQARANQDGAYTNFIGAGAYEHHIPAAVWEIVTRGEFYSAYTPYQAEASQGTLQLLYEYQTMMASLTGMDVSNASLYDGASALAEAVLMAVRAHKKCTQDPDAEHGASDLPARGARHRHEPEHRARGNSAVHGMRQHHSGFAQAVRRRRIRRAGDSAAEFLRRAGRRGRAHRLGACAQGVLAIAAGQSRSRWRCSSRRASGARRARTSRWAKASRSACRCLPADRTSASCAARRSWCARCRVASSGARSIRTANRVSR